MSSGASWNRSLPATNRPRLIHESFRLDRSYVYGIGLKVVIDVDVINQASIEAAIDRFIAVGETDWTSPEPVPRDRLRVVSELRHWQRSSLQRNKLGLDP